MKKDDKHIVAGILSFFLPGTGQIYKGNLKRGLMLFAAWFCLLAVTCFTCCPVVVYVPFHWWIAWDAYKMEVVS